MLNAQRCWIQTKVSFSLVRAFVIGALVASACGEPTGPDEISPKVAPDYSAKIVIGTRIIYLGASKAEPVNYFRAIVYDQSSGATLGSLTQAIDPVTNRFDSTVSVKLSAPGSTTARMTIELANRSGESEVVNYSGRNTDLKLSPGETRKVDVEVYPGPLDNFAVTSVRISDKPLSDCLEGDSVKAQATLTGGNSNVRIAWSGLDSTIARVNPSTGVITGKLPGTTQVVAAVGLVADTAQIRILQRRAAVVVNPSVVTLSRIGDTATFTAKVVDARGVEMSGGETISWASADAAIGELVAPGKIRSLKAGTTVVTASANADPTIKGTATFNVSFVAPSSSQSTIAASPTSIIANGTSTSIVTVRLRDAGGNNLGNTGATVTLSKSGGGTFSPVTNNGDGSYSATLTSPTAAGSATISGAIDGAPLSNTATVTFVPGPASLTNSVITATPASISANSTAAITVRLRDAFGNDLAASAGAVSLATTLGVLSPVVDNGNGTYSSTLTSGSVAGTAVISGTLNGATLTQTLSVIFGSGPPSTTTSPVTAVPTSIVANGTSQSVISIRLRDANGNSVGAGGANITASLAGTGTLGAVTDNGGGSYSAILTSPTVVGNGVVTAFISGSAITNTATVTYVAGAAARYVLTATPVVDRTTSIAAQLVDANGNAVGQAGRIITWTSTAGGSFATPTSATDANGSASIEFTVGADPNAQHTITATDNGTPPLTGTIGPIAGIPIPVSLVQSTISASPTSLVAGSAGTSTITVQLKDVNGAPTTAAAGQTVTVALSGTGTLSGLTSNGVGNYTATLTAPATPGSAVISASVGGSALTNASNPVTITFTATVPGQVIGLNASPGNTIVGLTWSAPTTNGGSTITDYLVEYKLSSSSTWVTFADGVSVATGLTVTGLANGTAYDFRVSAINSVGTGPSSFIATATPRTVPDAPTDLETTVSTSSSVTLTWSAPANNGGSAITDYVIEYKLGSWTTFNDGVSTATTTTVTGLQALSEYEFRISAVNAAGVGSTSTTVSRLVGSASAPTNLSVSLTQVGATSHTATLTWTASIPGASATTDYTIQYQVAGAGSYTTFAHSASTATTASITGLASGTTYNFRVSAFSGPSGAGPFSTVATATTPLTVSGAPTDVVLTAGNGQVRVNWTAPSISGGSAITDYLVEYKLTSSGTWLTFNDGVSATASATVTGLTNGSSYDFRVSAINATGTSAPSATASANPVGGPDDAPSALGATSGNTQVTLVWSAPLSTGGSAITDYLVEYKLSSSGTWLTFNDGVSATTGATVTGLTNGSAYDFRVSAINSVGTGPSSSTVTATPRTVPDAPTNLATTVSTSSSVTLTWTAPANDGGSSITDYVIEYRSGIVWSTFNDGVSTATTATVTGLVGATQYEFRVSAVNAAGTGSTSTTVSRVVGSASAPTNLSVTFTQVGPTSYTAALTWTASIAGSSAITDYTIQYQVAGAGSYTNFTHSASTATTASITGLASGTTYNFRVAAFSASGPGPFSTVSATTPP